QGVIVCGGTGLFLKHLIEGLVHAHPGDPAYRAEMEERIRREGLGSLRAELRRVDPLREAEIFPNDPFRVMRALEIFHTTGKTMSQWHAEDAESRTLRPHLYYVLQRPTPELDARIFARIDAMMEAGWLREVEALLERFPRTTRCFKALGYRELMETVLDSRPLPEALQEIKTKTRQFAKRQRTWFRGVRQNPAYNVREVNLSETPHEVLLEELVTRAEEFFSQI
ncbi:MAG: tRNA (adenosine(37)-N6)-dimethylallyltransferase MiaA, partial [Candidatus Sumerlaeia bacterium]|nr:tRNA (adenosine(37)-N6)-dimethylallyltransferase MiaA [Candidatus Sumerlaeia bacterium]